MRDDPRGFLVRENRGQPLRPMGAYHVVDPRQIDVHDAFVQKQDGRQGLGLCCCGNQAILGQMGQERGDLWSTHVAWVPLLMEQDETAYPVDISFFSPVTEMPEPYGGPDCVQKARWRIHRDRKPVIDLLCVAC